MPTFSSLTPWLPLQDKFPTLLPSRWIFFPRPPVKSKVFRQGEKTLRVSSPLAHMPILTSNHLIADLTTHEAFDAEWTHRAWKRASGGMTVNYYPIPFWRILPCLPSPYSEAPAFARFFYPLRCCWPYSSVWTPPSGSRLRTSPNLESPAFHRWYLPCPKVLPSRFKAPDRSGPSCAM